MLEKRSPSHLINRLRLYVDEVLGVPLKLAPAEDLNRHPAFLTGLYDLYEGYIAGRICLFLIAQEDTRATPGDIRKHIDLMSRDRGETLTIYVAPALSAHNRKRLINHLVPFIVPDNQLYIPDLAMDLREKLRRHARRRKDRLSPASQSVLISHLLGHGDRHENQSEIADRLNYSAMSIGRAFDDLVAAELASVRQTGRDRLLDFHGPSRDLFERAAPLLASPVRKTRFIEGDPDEDWMLLSGEAALSRYTSLAHPNHYQFALSSSAWRQLKPRWREVTKADIGPGVIEVATWAYDPRPLALHPTVDPISLHVIFRDHDDPRVSEAADQVLEVVQWH